MKSLRVIFFCSLFLLTMYLLGTPVQSALPPAQTTVDPCNPNPCNKGHCCLSEKGTAYCCYHPAIGCANGGVEQCFYEVPNPPIAGPAPDPTIAEPAPNPPTTGP